MASDTNDIKFFLLSVVAFNPHALIYSGTSDDFLPEEPSAVTWLLPWWEVRTKVTCDALTSVVGASKPTLDESFQTRADIFISSDDDSKQIVSQRSEPPQIVIIVLKSKGYGII